MTERFFPLTHSSARMTKLATGMARINCITGPTRVPNHRHRAPQAPSSSPTVTASTKPVKIRSALNPTLCQKSAVGSSRHKVCTVCRGVAKNKPL